MSRELPQGTVTILFTDVVGSTGITAGRGDESAHGLFSRQRELIRAEIERHEGHEIKTIGDGFMVAFASARRGVTCAMAIQQALERHVRAHPTERADVRIGLNTGETIADEGDDFFGAAVIAAERIMHKAGGGGILVSESVKAVLGATPDIRIVDRGRFRLKGFADRWRLFEVVWRSEEPAPAASGIERTPFVRRDAELAQLRTAFEHTTSGAGRVLLIAGEPGVGKTRLAEEFAADVRQRGSLALFGRAYEGGGGPPLGPLVEIIEATARVISPVALRAALGDALPELVRHVPAIQRIFPDVAPPAEERPAAVREAVESIARDILSSASVTRPVLVVVDDLHWADEATLQVVRYLARTIAETRLMLVLTFRDSDVDLASPLAQALDEFHRRRMVTQITLKPFTVDEVEAMLEASTGRQPPQPLARALHAETGGNAFFVEELLHHLSEELTLLDDEGNWRPDLRIDMERLPQGLRLVIERRLARLSQSASDMLGAAAIIGLSFDSSLVEPVSGLEHERLLDALDEAERAGLLMPEESDLGSRFRFSHPLTRAVAETLLTQTQRQRLHLRAAAAIERVDRSGDAYASALANHYRQAGALADPKLVVAALRRAALLALAARSNLEAESHLSTACAIAQGIPDFPPLDMADILHRRGRIGYFLGRWDDSIDFLDQALEAYRSAGDGPNAAEVYFSRASLHTFQARAHEALESLDRAAMFARPGTRLLGMIRQLQSQNLVQLRRYDEAGRAAREAIAVSDSLNDPYLTVRTRIASGYFALSTLDMRRAVDDFGRVSGSRDHGVFDRMAAASRGAMALVCVGRLDEAEHTAREALAYFDTLRDPDGPSGSDNPRDPYEYGLACLALGVVAMVRGRNAEASLLLRDAVHDSGTPPNAWVVRTLSPLVLQALHDTGRYDEAMDWMRTVVTPRGSERPSAIGRLYAALAGFARSANGAPADSMPSPPGRRPDFHSLAVAVLAAETALALRDSAAARAQIDSISGLHERGMLITSGWVALVPRLLGGLHLLLGDLESAARLLRSALVTAAELGAMPEIARTELELAELSLAQGNHEGAASALERARSGFGALGVHACDRRMLDVATRLEHLGRPLPDGLAADDAEMLKMIAAGLSNRRIAQMRAVSGSTVQRQIAHLYAKIGVANRAGAIAYSVRKGIIADVR